VASTVMAGIPYRPGPYHYPGNYRYS